MKNPMLLMCLLSLLSCSKQIPGPDAFTEPKNSHSFTATSSLPRPDHIIFVWFENKGYTSVVGSSSAPYINSLIARGTLFTNTYALTHPSYPNYVAWFAGTTCGITNDACIDGTPKTNTTLYNALSSTGTDMRWYSEGLPSIGSTTCSSGNYREKHNPVTIFSKVPSDKSRPFSLLDASLKDVTKYATMPKVICVTPDMQNDMHDGSIAQGDAWLKLHFASFINWATTHNSIVVVYWDEAEGSNASNRIPVIMVGQHVKANYLSATRYDHYNFTRTVCSMFSASNNWTTNLSSRLDISGCWE